MKPLFTDFKDFYGKMHYKTQLEAAADLGVSQGYISLLLRQERTPKEFMHNLMVLKLREKRALKHAA